MIGTTKSPLPADLGATVRRPSSRSRKAPRLTKALRLASQGIYVAADPMKPSIEHIHTVVRTPNGNDYGKDLLRQHYEQHPHPH